VLRDHQAGQEETRRTAGSRWHGNDLVFPSQVGTPADASHIRRSFRTVMQAAGLIEVIALKGDSYRLKNRDLGRVPAAGNTDD
jgi:hypothetical protein